MAHHDFVFSVQVADASRFDGMLATVADALIRHAGCQADTAAAILDAVHGALVEGAAAGFRQCHVEFRSAGHELRIVVAYAGGREWHATHALP